MDMAQQQKDYPHLDGEEKTELIKKDIEIKLFQDQVDELKLKRIKMLQKGPLLCIKDDQKVKDFAEICQKLYKNNKKFKV